VFRLVRWLFWLLVFIAALWFSATVKLGKRTLFGHLHAIFTSREARELADGTQEEAHRLADRLREPSPHPTAMDPVGEKDRKALDKLVHEKTRK
jgi:hypothetical protein